MKKQPKINFSILKIGVFLFLTSLLMYNCQNEKIETEPELNIVDRLSINKISFNNLKKEYPKLLEKLDKKLKKTNQKNTSDDNTYLIDTTGVIKITDNNGFLSFTFTVIPKNDAQLLQNIILLKYANNNSKAMLVEYTLNEDINNINIEDIQDNIVETTYYDLDNPTLINTKSLSDPDCLEVGYYIYILKCEGQLVTPSENPECFDENGQPKKVRRFITIAKDCTYSSGGNPNSSGSNNNSSDNLFNGVGDNAGGDDSSQSSDNFDLEIPDNTIISSPTTPSNGNFLIYNLNLLLEPDLNRDQEFWIAQNQEQGQEILDFLNLNPNSQQEGSNILNILMNSNLTQEQKLEQIKAELESVFPLLPDNLTQDTYSTRVSQIANWIKIHGQVEFGNYIESLVPEFPNMTAGEVYDVYRLSRDVQLNIQGQIWVAIIYTVAKTFQPFLEFAVIDATLGVAIPILAKIPLAFVSRGAKLEAMIIEVTELGVQESQFIRVINNSSIAKAEELFSALSKDAISTYSPTEGVIVADMGQGNFITFRTISGSGFPATIDFNFVELLGTNDFKIKFSL